MTEQRRDQEPDDVTRAEAEIESDVMDADVEGIGEAPRSGAVPPTPAHEPAELGEDELAEAEAEADVMDADVEGT